MPFEVGNVNSDLEGSPYITVKCTFNMETYLLHIHQKDHRKDLTLFRRGELQITTIGKRESILRNLRFCPFRKAIIEDESHFT